MSPEAIFDGVFTTQSDIWSFGVTLWEVMTMGRQPYPGMDNKQVIECVKNGGHPEISERCPSQVANIMVGCWSDVNNRPSFTAILKALQSIYIKKEENLRCKSSLSSHEDDFDLSMYTSDTSTTFLTNSSNEVTKPTSSQQLNFIEKYTSSEVARKPFKVNEKSSGTEMAILLGKSIESE